MSRLWSGQSEKEYMKNYTRVRDIVKKSEGDEDKDIKLSQIQANS